MVRDTSNTQYTKAVNARTRDKVTTEVLCSSSSKAHLDENLGFGGVFIFIAAGYVGEQLVFSQ